MLAAGHDEATAVRDVGAECREHPVGKPGPPHVVQHDDVVATEPGGARGESGRPHHLGLHSAPRERHGGDRRGATFRHHQDAERSGHGEGRLRRAGQPARRRQQQPGREAMGAAPAGAQRQRHHTDAGRERHRPGHERLAVDRELDRRRDRASALHHRLDGRQRVLRRQRRREEPAQNDGRQPGGRGNDREDRQARLHQDRLGDEAALRLVAVAEQEERGLLALGAEGGRARERGGEIGVGGLRVIRQRGREQGRQRAPAGGRRRDDARMRREGDRADQVVGAECRNQVGEEPARRIDRGALDARRHVDGGDDADAARRPVALVGEAGERQHDRRRRQHATGGRREQVAGAEEEERQRDQPKQRRGRGDVQAHARLPSQTSHSTARSAAAAA